MKLNQYEWNPETDKRGDGAFAEVFEAKDNNGDSVALKVYREAIVKGSTGGGSTNGKYSLQDEFLKGKLLSHTNVIRYIGLDFIEYTDVMQRKSSYPVLIMEYADAGSLEGWLRSPQPPSKEEVLKIIRGLLNGLAYLHEEGIIHRDLKPANILFKKDRRGNRVAKITDFGISRDMLEENIEAQSATAGVGSMIYMAPEQFLKKTYGLNGTITGRTDIWAVGVILYRLLTGKLPFGGEGGEWVALQDAITTKEPDYSLVPVEFISAIKGCLVKHAANRLPDAEAVLKLLDESIGKGATIVAPDKAAIVVPFEPVANIDKPQHTGNETIVVPPISSGKEKVDKTIDLSPVPNKKGDVKTEKSWFDDILVSSIPDKKSDDKPVTFTSTEPTKLDKPQNIKDETLLVPPISIENDNVNLKKNTKDTVFVSPGSEEKISAKPEKSWFDDILVTPVSNKKNNNEYKSGLEPAKDLTVKPKINKGRKFIIGWIVLIVLICLTVYLVNSNSEINSTATQDSVATVKDTTAVDTTAKMMIDTASKKMDGPKIDSAKKL